MNEITLVFLLLWSSGTDTASAVYVHSPEEVTVHNGTTGRACGVPAIKPKVPGCPSDGLGIINGTEAVPHSWPWQVSLQTCCGPPFCGGTLIKKDWVVAAAHCEVRTCHRVILGQHNLKLTRNIQKIRIGKVFSHPNYNNKTLDYDIALIKLKRPAQMNCYVSPVCVAETGDDLRAGMKCVATGWGHTRYDPPRSPDKLQQACVPLISFKDCNSFYSGQITTRMLCAGVAGADTCQGDGGGPLVYKKNGAWTLVGVSSWEDCNTRMPGIYSNVPNLRAWMDQTMAAN